MIEGFNKTIDYIESVMKDEIDEKRIMELSGYSYAVFRRIFSILTETTLSEYIRARKLTEAAKRIRETDEKIIEIAFEYGYDSPDSFGLAFKNFHGYTPSEVRKGKSLLDKGKQELSSNENLFQQSEKFLDKEVTVQGWVKTIRDSNKFAFIELNDGTFFSNLQIVLEAENKNAFLRVDVGSKCLKNRGQARRRAL